jgi:hypothetical protein
MNKILLTGLILASSLMSYAQKTDSLAKAIQKNAETIGQGGNNELKINLLFSVIGMPEITYERILKDNMGVGLSAFVGLDNDIDYTYGITPYFRVYFGQKKASGFFIEGNASVIGNRSYHYIPSYSNYYPPNPSELQVKVTETSFGLGAAAGGKFLTRNGFLGEAYLGVGRLLGERHSYSGEAYPRIGITIGKRF